MTDLHYQAFDHTARMFAGVVGNVPGGQSLQDRGASTAHWPRHTFIPRAPTLAVGEPRCCKETTLSLFFKGSDLKPALAETIANQCPIILVKDPGVYWLAERGDLALGQ
ncbi:hypothetical protein PspCFBP13528_15350 [Pseudomonas sp. CFBP13528]|nr:hypothetical protein PspCFBP13528_15350 [Pseudomonas sp. CFBP13528]